MLAIATAGSRPPVERFDAHLAHQNRYVLAANREALAIEQVAKHPAARERMLEVQSIRRISTRSASEVGCGW